MSRKGQGALEFTIITVTMLIAFAGIFLFMEYQFQQAQLSRETALVQEVLAHIQSEIELAGVVGEGYQRVFYVPQTIIGIPYEIYIHLRDPGIAGSRDELIIEYRGVRHLWFIPHDITGPFPSTGLGYTTEVTKGYMCIRGGNPIELIPLGTDDACPT